MLKQEETVSKRVTQTCENSPYLRKVRHTRGENVRSGSFADILSPSIFDQKLKESLSVYTLCYNLRREKTMNSELRTE